MKSSDVDDVKALLSQQMGVADTDAIKALSEITGKLPIPEVGLGKTRIGDEFKLAVFDRGMDPAELARIEAAAAGEIVVFRVPVLRPLITSSWSKKPKDIGEIGQQVGPEGFPWVGTGGVYVWSAFDPTVMLEISNEHVTGMRAPRGRPMHQGGRRLGYVWATGGIRFDSINAFDVGSIACRRGYQALTRWEHGLQDNLEAIRSLTDDDIGQEATNTGQTVGTRKGACIAKDIDGLAIGYDGGVARFNGWAAFAAPVGAPSFSVAGHSGSSIVMVHDKSVVTLLAAGGPESGTGRDLTFGCDMPGAIMAAGGVPELIRQEAA